MSNVVNTIDSYQGSEKEAVIFSCVRSNDNGNLGFCSEYRRINVALTRAKFGQIIVGNLQTLRKDPKWKILINFLEKEGNIVDGFEGALHFFESHDDPDLRE